MSEALEIVSKDSRSLLQRKTSPRRKVETAVFEAYLAKKLMEDGFIKNAAGKAFDA